MDRIGPNMDRIGPHPWTVLTRAQHEIIIPYLTGSLRMTLTDSVNDRIGSH